MDTFVGEKLAVRTLVQLDGDVFTFVTPFSGNTAALHAVHEQHWKRVERTLKKIYGQIKHVVQYATWTAAFLSFVIISVPTLQGISFDDWDTNIWITYGLVNVILPVAIGTVGHIGFLRRLVTPVILKLLRFWIKQHAG